MPTHATGTGLAPLLSIIVESRLRTDSEDERIRIEEELVPSIAERGLIHPITVALLDTPTTGPNLKGETITSDKRLIAGWSRMISFSMIGEDLIPYNTRESLPQSELYILEVEENIRRQDMDWKDVCLSIKKVHDLKKAEYDAGAERGRTGRILVPWTGRATGHLLHCSSGHVEESLRYAKLISEKDGEILAAVSMTEARRICMKRREDEIQKRLHDKHKENLKTKKRPKASKLLPDDSLPAPQLLIPSGTPCDLVDKEPTDVPISEMLFQTDCHEWFATQQPESIDLIYTDIPFGIDMKNLETIVDIARVEDAHDINENIEQMPRFLSGAYKVLKPDTYLLFWYDILHQEKLRSWAEAAGFSVQPYPNVWLKTHSCRNQAAHCHWTKAVEYVMVCRKGSPTLSKAQAVNYFACSGYEERQKQRNPFAKPFEFSKWLLDPVIKPGMTVLDCYAGEGSLVRALLTLNCNVIAIEQSDLHFPRLVEHVKTFYRSVLSGPINYI